MTYHCVCVSVCLCVRYVCVCEISVCVDQKTVCAAEQHTSSKLYLGHSMYITSIQHTHTHSVEADFYTL